MADDVVTESNARVSDTSASRRSRAATKSRFFATMERERIIADRCKSEDCSGCGVHFQIERDTPLQEGLGKAPSYSNEGLHDDTLSEHERAFDKRSTFILPRQL